MKKRKFSINPLILVLIVEAIIVIGLYALGFRITYNPKLINDWNAIEAVGTWFCGLIVPFVLVALQKKISDSEKKTSASNLATLEELQEFKKQYEPLLKAAVSGELILDGGEIINEAIPSQQEIYRYICVSMITSTEKIAEHFGVETESLRNRLMDMWAVQEIISIVDLSDDPHNKFEKCKWKKA